MIQMQLPLQASVVGIIVHICAQAVQDRRPQHEDGRAPAQTISPVELMVTLQQDAVDEFDGIKD